MTHENTNITIMKRLMDLVYKLRWDPVRFEEALDDLTTEITNDPVESGFQAGQEYSANLLEEFIHEFRGIVQQPDSQPKVDNNGVRGMLDLLGYLEETGQLREFVAKGGKLSDLHENPNSK